MQLPGRIIKYVLSISYFLVVQSPETPAELLITEFEQLGGKISFPFTKKDYVIGNCFLEIGPTLLNHKQGRVRVCGKELAALKLMFAGAC